MAQLVTALTGWARRLVPCLGSPVQSQAGAGHYNLQPQAKGAQTEAPKRPRERNIYYIVSEIISSDFDESHFFLFCFLSGSFTPCRHIRPSSGREHTIV